MTYIPRCPTSYARRRRRSGSRMSQAAEVAQEPAAPSSVVLIQRSVNNPSNNNTSCWFFSGTAGLYHHQGLSSRNRRRRATNGTLLRAKAIAYGCMLSVANVASFGGTYAPPQRPRPPPPSTWRFVENRFIVDAAPNRPGRAGGRACSGTNARGGGGRIDAGAIAWGAGRFGYCHMSTVMEPPTATRAADQRHGRLLPPGSSFSTRDASWFSPAPKAAAPSTNSRSVATRRRRMTMPTLPPPTRLSRERAIRDMCEELRTAKLLTRDEEYELGIKIQALMQYNSIYDRLMMHHGREPTEQEWADSCCMTPAELKVSLNVCETAKRTMVRSNMRMVISIARRYQHLGVPMIDLIQEGSMGLIRAVEKFDPERGFKLSTYSAWWIQQAMFKGIARNSRVIRLPVHVHNLLNNVRKAQKELRNEAGKDPSDDAVAMHLDIPVHKLKQYLGKTKDTLSFDIPSSSKPSAHTGVMGDNIESHGHVTPEKEMEKMLFRAKLREILHELPEAERTIVALRFGLDDGKTKTIPQIASLVQTTNFHVRAVETKAMRKLRTPSQQRRLRDFFTAASPALGAELLSEGVHQ